MHYLKWMLSCCYDDGVQINQMEVTVRSRLYPIQANSKILPKTLMWSMTSVGWVTSFSVVLTLLCLFFQRASGGVFESYCSRPKQPSKPGKLEGNLCTVVFKWKTKTKAKAYENCNAVAPFDIEEAIPGEHTTCKYLRPAFDCKKPDEKAIDQSCVVIRGNGPFDQYQEACGAQYRPHVVERRQNILWITVFFYGTAVEVWAADEGPEAVREFKPIKQKRRRRRRGTNSTDGGMAIKFRMISSADGIQYGTALYADTSEKHPFLCSRKAVMSAHAVNVMADDAKQLGFNVKTFKDRHGDNRPFVVFDTVHAVEASKFDANFDKFKDMCSMFANGYVASRYDFYNYEEYKKAISGVSRYRLFRTTVSRGPDKTEPFDCNDKDLAKNQDVYSKAFKIKFNYHLPFNSSTAQVKPDHWAPSYPMNTCADTPRITAVMSADGYRDMPAIARLPVICTFGNPPDVQLRGKNDICSQAAHFDEKEGRCVCNNPQDDATVQEPKRYANFPPGTLCVTCNSRTETKSVLFIMDRSSTVGEKGMEQEKEFMLKMMSVMKKVRAGVAVISCPSFKALEVREYTSKEMRDARLSKGSTYKLISTSCGLAKSQVVDLDIAEYHPKFFYPKFFYPLSAVNGHATPTKSPPGAPPTVAGLKLFDSSCCCEAATAARKIKIGARD
ncbi:hypothetical protein GCK32_009146 [Trichostrongylus colubriformis]|uniref:Uncharacterized protein n=1 Tax=Trichostrongylus colubriformis TaxID=6319 RepID=A0AAN8IUN8_TRICO